MSILIVEDNPVSVKVLDLNLRKQGYKTVMAKSGKEALEALENNSDINLILSDIMMPEMNGLQLLELIKANAMWSSIPVIMCTAMADMDIVKQAVALGCKHYVVKPLNIGQVLGKVREVLREVRPVLLPKRKIMSQYNLDNQAYNEIVETFSKLINTKVDLLKEHLGKEINKEFLDSIFELLESASLIGAERIVENLEKIQEAKKDGDQGTIKNELAHLLHELQQLQIEITKLSSV